MPGWAKASNLAELTRDNLGLLVTCRSCGHKATPDIMQLRRDLAQLGGYREEMKDLPKWLICSNCREKNLGIEVVAGES